MNVRSVEFRQPVDLPGRSQAEKAHEFLPERAHERGYVITADMKLRLMRFELPDHAIFSNTPRWTHNTGVPNYYQGPVKYVPFEMIRGFDLCDDARPPEPPKPAAKQEPVKPAPATSKDRP